MTANSASFLFDIAGSDFDVTVVDFTAYEKLSAPYVINVALACEESIPFEAVLNKESLLTVLGSSNSFMGQAAVLLDLPDRYFHGVVRKFKQVGTSGRFNLFEAQIVPNLWSISLRKNNRIFQNMKVQDIVGKVLNEGGILSDRFEFRLQHENLNRKFCVQFQETDFNFISRLLEEEGIFYFFEHYADRHILVFCDTSAYYQDIQGPTSIRFNPNGRGMVADAESIYSFDFSDRLRSGKFAHTNYNFKTPTLDITTENESEEDGPIEVYEYPGSYGEPDRGNKLAQVRMQSILALKEKGSGQSSCGRLVPGVTFNLTHHDDTNLNNKYLLFEVIHGGSQPGSLAEQSGDATPTYGNEFVVIPATVTYRPLRTHRKPMIPGIQTARVTGPPGEEIYPDQYGRVKVQFPWDREGKGDEKTSCWLRVAQFWNSGFEGSQFIPRVGDEVLVAFVNGDMDYPIIIGSNVNENMRPNYDLPANKTQSGIRTRSYPNGGRDNYHELRFEDKKGSEEIYLQSEKDWNILVKNDKGQTVGRDESLTVGNNRSKTVGVNQSESIGVDKTIQVGANHNETIGANMTLSVGGFKNERVGINSLEMIGGAKELAIGGLYQVAVGGIMNETVAGAKTEEVGLAKAVFVGNNMIENVTGDRTTNTGGNYTETTSGKYYAKANEYVIEAPKITLKAGSSTIVMDGSSITIKASKVFTN